MEIAVEKQEKLAYGLEAGPQITLICSKHRSPSNYIRLLCYMTWSVRVSLVARQEI
jgi:hypothetical protein